MLRDIRTNYQKDELDESSVSKDPFEQFSKWLNEALNSNIPEPTAMVLSSLDETGYPDSRVVLLKELTQEGFVFFTNYNSKKGKQLENNPHLSIVFFWPILERQVRIKGTANKTSHEISASYYASRPVDSQLGAWASPQSELIENRKVLDENYRHYQKFFQNHEIEKPPHWGGFLIRPEYFEFWQGRPNRLHDRIEYVQSADQWIIHRLAP